MRVLPLTLTAGLLLSCTSQPEASGATSQARRQVAPPRENADGTAFAVSDPNMLVASGPVAAWQDDHWTITWSTGESRYEASYPNPRNYPAVPTRPQLHVADIAEDGAMTARPIDFRERHELVQGDATQVAVIKSPDILAAPGCELRLANTDAASLTRAFGFDCPSPGNMAVAAIADSQDWLVAWSTGYTGQRSAVMLARYRAGRSGWLAGPWSVVQDNVHEWISLGVAGQDAWLSWVNAETGTTLVAQLSGVAGETPAEPAGDPSLQTLSTPVQRARYAFAATDDGALMFYTTGQELKAVKLSAEELVERALLATSQGTGTGVGNKLGAARVAEQGLIAVCYPQGLRANVDTSNKIAVVVVDEEGQLVAGPVEVSDEARSADCAVAWSGNALLVAWWESALYMAETDYSMIKARIMPLPAPADLARENAP